MYKKDNRKNIPLSLSGNPWAIREEYLLTAHIRLEDKMLLEREEKSTNPQPQPRLRHLWKYDYGKHDHRIDKKSYY